MERRRHKRHLSHQSVSLHFARRLVTGWSVDVSLSGMLVMTESPPALRQLVKVRITLPNEGRTLELQAMAFRVTHQLAGQEGLYAVALQFFGMYAEEMERWRAFIAHAAAGEDSASMAHRAWIAERSRVNVKPGFDLQWDSMDELMRRYSVELSGGGCFIETGARLLVGTDVQLRVVHPSTGGVFSLDATVCRKTLNAHKDGVAVRLLSPPRGWKLDFLQFIGSGTTQPAPRVQRDWLN